MVRELARFLSPRRPERLCTAASCLDALGKSLRIVASEAHASAENLRRRAKRLRALLDDDEPGDALSDDARAHREAAAGYRRRARLEGDDDPRSIWLRLAAIHDEKARR